MKEKLLVGNCLETLKEIPDNSIDSVVTDPPYELGFMGKSWDNTGIAFNVKVWQECMRVLKPGGHLLAFSGSRTYHRMAVAIEDAGFEIRDQIMWIYGSGFPKSMAIDKAIDKSKGATRKIIGNTGRDPERLIKYKEQDGVKRNPTNENITEPSTKEAKQWQGWGTALKPAHEPIVVARKPISEKTVAENVLTYGTGAINIDASRVGTEQLPEHISGSHPKDIGEWGLKEGHVTSERTGRFPANLILSHNPDCQEISEATLQSELPKEVKGGIWQKGTGNGKPAGNTYTDTPAVYNCTEGCPFLEFPNSNGAGGSTPNVKVTGYGNGIGNGVSTYTPNDRATFDSGTGTAARFFYCAKTSKSERNAGLTNEAQIESDRKDTTKVGSDNPRNRSSNAKQNFHPTVKPLTLIRYLIKLTTKPGGTVLDPFLGSGTTAVAATLDGYNWVGCELTEEYLPIINGRVAYAKAEVAKAKKKKETTPTLFEEDKDVL